MQIRKLTYTIAHIHILTFQNFIRQIIAPYFQYNLEYGIDFEGTLKENVRLIFRSEGFIMQFNKEHAILVYEGPGAAILKSNPQVDIFFEIYKKISHIDSFVQVANHTMDVDFVQLTGKEEYENSLVKNKFTYSPFDRVNEFATTLEFDYNDYSVKVQYGNFATKDIKKYNLSPLNTGHNADLENNCGFMAQVRVAGKVKEVNFTKFKNLIHEGQRIIDKYTN